MFHPHLFLHETFKIWEWPAWRRGYGTVQCHTLSSAWLIWLSSQTTPAPTLQLSSVDTALITDPCPQAVSVAVLSGRLVGLLNVGETAVGEVGVQSILDVVGGSLHIVVSGNLMVSIKNMLVSIIYINGSEKLVVYPYS